MPASPARVVLEFSKKVIKGQPELATELSAVECIGDDLWLGADEGTALERLSPDGPDRYGHHGHFPLEALIDLPAGTDHEIDIEGMAYREPYLWVAGSHSLTRKKPKGKHLAKDLARLAEMERETNRFLLARVPVRFNPDTGRSELFEGPDPSRPEVTLRASRLFGTTRTNLLTDLVEDDPHLGRFLSVPCKENGFDIEGLALVGKSLWLGLRGPVLRSWAVVLEIRPTELSDEFLTLKPFGKTKALYRKHFLDLHGLGIRELCQDGDDLLILAGPTMDVTGPLRLLRWRDAASVNREQILERDDLEFLVELSANDRPQGVNQAEGVCIVPDRGLLIVYDSPEDERVRGGHEVTADLLPFPR